MLPTSSPLPSLQISALALAACVLVYACGDDSSAADSTEVDAATPVLPLACNDLNAATPGQSTREIMVAGVARNYELSIPSDYDPAAPARLVFGWHGLGGSGALLMAYTTVEGSSQSAPGDAASIFVYPDGLVLADFGATAWSDGDADFFDAMVSELSGEFCVDSSRIFSYGHSFGGYFSNLLGCLRGEVLRAIAPVAGGLLQDGMCDSPMPVWLAHATDDTVVPLSQGQAARDKWLAQNECTPSTGAVTPSPCVAYDQCQSGAQVVWCQAASGGHAWPAYANSGIWDFFASFATQAP